LLPSALQLPPIATDDDAGGGTDSLISMYVEAGTYSILANSARVTAETGSYILTTTFTTVTPIGLTGGSPLPGRVERNEETSYEVPVVSGARYTVSITGLTDNATVRVLGGNSECAVLSLNVSPKDCPIMAAGTLLTIRVEGDGVTGTAADYVVMAVPAVVATAQPPGGMLPLARTTDSRSRCNTRYQPLLCDQSQTRHSHRQSLASRTMRIYTFSPMKPIHLSCTAPQTARRCYEFAGGLYLDDRNGCIFSLTSVELTRDGAGYVTLVW
jgi:hypothetical protein